jgi:type IV secretion system protein TrbL
MSLAPAELLAWEFPNPISWAVDKVAGFVGDVATAGFELVVGGLVAWVTDAVVWLVGGIFNFFLDAQDPNVQADWFITGHGPYATTASIGGTLAVGFVLAGVAQGALQGDVSGMLRRMALDLPMTVIGIVGLVTFTQALIRLTDVLSTWVMSNFESDVADFTAVVGSLSQLTGGGAGALVVFLLGLTTVLAGLVLVAELAVRSALVYIVVALAPLVFAAQLWPALKGVGQKLLRMLCGLIVAKLAMAVALAVAAAAAVGTGSGGEVTSLPPPEVFAEDPGGSVTQAVGILLAATAAFGVAAFMPFFVAKLFPLAEEAAVAQGLRGAPIRVAQLGMSLAYYGQMVPRLAGGWPRGGRGGAPGKPPGPPGIQAGGGAGPPPPPGSGPAGGRNRSGRPPGAGSPSSTRSGSPGARPKAGKPAGERGRPGGTATAGGPAAAGPVGVAASGAAAAARSAGRVVRRSARPDERQGGPSGGGG